MNLKEKFILKRRYFTLLEVVLATMVIFIGMGSIWSFFSFYSNQKKNTFFELKIERDFRETIALYEAKLLQGDHFYTRADNDEKSTEIANDEIMIHGMKVMRIVQLHIKKAEDGKEALLEFTLIYKHPSLQKRKKKDIHALCQFQSI